MSSTCTPERKAKEPPLPPLPPKGVTGKVLGWQSKGSEDVPNELHKGNRVLPCESLGRKGGDGRVMKDEAHWVAVTGKRGEPGMRPIKGICTTFSQNRMILLQGDSHRSPLTKKWKIRAKEWFEGVKGMCRTSSQMPFLEYPKKGHQTDCPERSIKARMWAKLRDTKKNVWGDRMLLSRHSPFDLM